VFLRLLCNFAANGAGPTTSESDRIKPNQTQSNPIKPNQTESNRIKPKRPGVSGETPKTPKAFASGQQPGRSRSPRQWLSGLDFRLAPVARPEESRSRFIGVRGWIPVFCLYLGPVSHKSGKVEALIMAFRGQELDAHYLAFFECFNQQLFFEAHDVLETLWLKDRHGPKASFYKGLIQLAGAFVHLQKNRLRPSAALFRLARENLRNYPATQDRLDVAGAVQWIEGWLGKLESADFAVNPLSPGTAPVVNLQKEVEVVPTKGMGLIPHGIRGKT
jgi:hypothetical protein